MKILILTNNDPVKNSPNNGIFIHQQVKALQELGADCHVLLLHNWFPPLGLHKLHIYWQQGYDAFHNFFNEYDGVNIHKIPMYVRMPGRLFRDNYYDRAARSIVKYVKRHKDMKGAEWLYAHFLTENSYIAVKVKQQLNIKVAAIARGDDVHAWPEQNPSLVNNIRYVFEHADVMLANNKRLAMDALKFADKTRPEFRIAYNGINYREFTRKKHTANEAAALRLKYKLPERKKILLCIARAEYLKGWNELLEAIAMCREQLEDWVLLAVTDEHGGAFSMNVPEKVASTGVQDKVSLQKFVPYAEVKELYWLADAFILPSYNEGISNAAMEAMAAGLWVIATDVGGHAEIMQNDVSGFLIAPRSVEAIRESLEYLVANFDSRNGEVSAAAVKAMIELGDYKDNAKKLLSYLS